MHKTKSLFWHCSWQVAKRNIKNVQNRHDNQGNNTGGMQQERRGMKKTQPKNENNKTCEQTKKIRVRSTQKKIIMKIICSWGQPTLCRLWRAHGVSCSRTHIRHIGRSGRGKSPPATQHLRLTPCALPFVPFGRSDQFCCVHEVGSAHSDWKRSSGAWVE